MEQAGHGHERSFFFKLSLVVWAAATAVIVWKTYPLLSLKEPAGWDMPGHYYLFHKMLDYLAEGRISGYDPNWFGGYPAFTLYPPLAYIAMALPYFLSLSLIPPVLAFNLFVFALPFLFLAALHWTAVQYVGAKWAPLAVILGLCHLLLPIDFAHLNFGLMGLLLLGTPVSLVGTCLWIALLGLLPSLRGRSTAVGVILVGTLLAVLILSHTLSAIFALWTVVLYSALNRASRRVCLAGTALGLALSAFWWIPFFINFPYSSGVPIGMPAGYFSDPLFAIFPDLTTAHLKGLLPLAQTTAVTVSGWTFHVPDVMAFFPYLGLFLLITIPVGLTVLVRREEWFLPALFVVSLIIFPRDLLPSQFTPAIHYYRFLQHISVAALLLSCAGTRSLWGFTVERMPPFVPLARVSAYVLALLMVVTMAMFSLDWQRVPRLSRYAASAPRFHLTLDRFPEAAAAERMARFAGALPKNGRIAVEGPASAVFRYGSPHYFSSKLALQYGAEVVPGLLAESALSAGFLNPTLAAHSEHYTIGRRSLLNEPTFRTLELPSILKRLGLYNVRYILTTSDRFRRELQRLPEGDVTLLRTEGDFGLFELSRHTRPLLQSGFAPPFLFISAGGMPFVKFAERWYSHDQLLEFPVIHSPGNSWDELPQAEREKIGGLIVSYPDDRKLSGSDYRRWQSTGRPVLFLGALPPDEADEHQKKRFFPRFDEPAAQRAFSDTFLALQRSTPERRQPSGTVTGRGDLMIKGGGGILVNYNFAPGWRTTPSGTIYLATPSLLWLFTDNDSVLKYK